VRRGAFDSRRQAVKIKLVAEPFKAGSQKGFCEKKVRLQYRLCSFWVHGGETFNGA